MKIIALIIFSLTLVGCGASGGGSSGSSAASSSGTGSNTVDRYTPSPIPGVAENAGVYQIESGGTVTIYPNGDVEGGYEKFMDIAPQYRIMPIQYIHTQETPNKFMVQAALSTNPNVRYGRMLAIPINIKATVENTGSCWIYMYGGGEASYPIRAVRMRSNG